jgi:hypothetical protein
MAEFADEPELVRFCVVEAWRSSTPDLRERSLAARDLFVALLAEHHVGDPADSDGVHLEILVGAAHHLVGDEIEKGRCDPEGIARRLDELIELFEPTQAPAG